jgi:hypothetical protein
MTIIKIISIVLIIILLIMSLILIQIKNEKSLDYQNSPGDGSDGLPRMQLPDNKSLNQSWINAYNAGYTFVYYQNYNNYLVEENVSKLLNIT